METVNCSNDFTCQNTPSHLAGFVSVSSKHLKSLAGAVRSPWEKQIDCFSPTILTP